MNGTIEAVTNYAVSGAMAPIQDQIIKVFLATGTKIVIAFASLFGIRIAPGYFRIVAAIIFGIFTILSIVGILELIQIILQSI